MVSTGMEFLNDWRRILATPDVDHNREIDTDSTFRCVFGVSEGQPLFFVVSRERPQPLELAESISVSIRRRSDNLWVLSFRLLDPSLTGVFLHLCQQLAEAALAAETERELKSGLRRVVTEWRKMLRTSPTLSDEALRGLVAELWTLQHVAIPRCEDPNAAVGAWEGPSGKPKDFVAGDGWAREVKAVGLQGTSVEIHGAEQLDDSGFAEFHLEVITTEFSAQDGHTLPENVAAIREGLDDASGFELESKVSQIAPGFTSSTYATRRVAVRRHRSYPVNSSTPRLTPADIAPGVNRLTYTIDLSCLRAETDTPVKKESQWTR